MKKKYNLSKIFLNSMLLLTVVSIVSIACLWTWQEYSIFHQESENLQERMLDSYKNLLRTQVQKAVDYIEYSKSLTEEQLQISLRERVYESHTMASHLYEKWKGKKSTEEIQIVIKESLRAIRFNQNRGYFFITDLDGVNQLLADRPELEGKNMLEVTNSNEANITRDLINIVKQKTEGFYQYNWTKPGPSEDLFPKIGFVKFFKPYNWIIGTGEYLNDYELNIKANVLNYLETIRYENNGYIFVTQWDGLDLTGPAKGRNMLGATDINGVKIVQELIALAKYDGGFIRYVMPKLKGKKPDPKLSYAQGIKDWQWYVGAGIYIDDIDKAIKKNQVEMIKKIIYSLMQISVVLLGLLVFAYFFARKTSRNAQNSFELFTKFFDKGAYESAAIDPDTMEYKEFEKLAHSANDMIKARERARSALITSEKKFRLIVENLNDLIIKLDRDKNLIFASPNYYDLFEKTIDEIINQSFLSLVLEENHTAVQKSLNNLDQAPYTSYHEEYTLTKSGWRWLAWSNRAILDTDGEPVEYVSVGRDITEKKLAEEASMENQEWLQNILDSIQAGVIVIEPETHKIIELNRAALEMIGTKKEEIINNICHNYICPNEIGMCPVTDFGVSIEQSDRQLITADGTRIPILKTVNNATINGKAYLIESFLDMRDKKKLETQLQQAQKMEAMGTLAGGIAHDFNNILSGIFGYAQLLEMDINNHEKVKNHLDKIVKGAKRASDLVQQILTFSRQTEPQKLSTTVFVILDEALKLLRSSIPTSIEIKKQIFSKAKIMADPTQIHQVIMNLCTNAYQSMRDTGGILTVGLHEIEISRQERISDLNMSPGKYLKLEISDTGYGMEEKTLRRIFDPYFTTKRIEKGTGLGLSTVDGIVKKHNGCIKVFSTLGEGSKFQVFLPVIEDDKLVTTPKKKATFIKGSEKIMLVDDESSILDSLKAILSIHGYKVSTFNNGESALKIFKENPSKFDLIITDMTMPHMTGDKLSSEILKIRPDIPIVVCTGYNANFTKEDAIKLGIKKYIHKPLIGAELSKIIRDLLDTKHK